MVKQTTAAVVSSGHTHDSFAFEYWNGTTWTEINSFSVHHSLHYRYANEVFIRANTTENIKLGINENSTMFPWSTKAIGGTSAYWIRIRIKTAITTAPVFEQFKITPNHSRISGDGFTSLSGNARYSQTIVAAGNIFGESGGVSSANITVGSGSVPTGWSHRVKNSRFDSNGDGIYIQFPLPRGVCTSCNWYISFKYFGDKTAQDIDWICSFLPVEVAGVLEADPTGGTTPVERTLANCETVISKQAQTKTLSNIDQTLNKINTLEFGPFNVSNYYEGDMIFLRLEMDDDGPNNANPTVLSFEVSGVKWTYGGHV